MVSVATCVVSITILLASAPSRNVCSQDHDLGYWSQWRRCRQPEWSLADRKPLAACILRKNNLLKFLYKLVQRAFSTKIPSGFIKPRLFFTGQFWFCLFWELCACFSH